MTVTRHPMFVNGCSGLRSVPADQELVERLRETHGMLPPKTVSTRFAEFMSIGKHARAAGMIDNAKHIASELESVIAGLIAGPDAPCAHGRAVRRLGVSLRRYGMGPPDVPRLVGTLMAAMVDVAGHRWRMQTIVEWAQAVTLLFEASLGVPPFTSGGDGSHK